MPGHQIYALGIFRIGSAKHGVDIGDLSRLGNALSGLLNEAIERDF